MIIGIDISMLVYQGSGVATYTYNFTKNLLKFDRQNKYKLFYSSFRRPSNFCYLDEFKKLGATVCDYRFPPKFLKLCWNKLNIIPVEWFIGKVDYFFSSDFLRPPLLEGTKGITTIHDLTWKIFPQYHTKEIIDAHARKLSKTIKYQDIIIVDSNNTKKDLLHYYPNIHNTNRVEVIYPGIDARFKPIRNQDIIKQVLNKYKIEFPKRYLLYVGAIEPRKNLDTAIKVFSNLIKDNKYSDFEFLIVGRAGWKNENVINLIDKLDLKNIIKLVGYVNDNDLPFFYNACKVFIYLSKYEGFGLPPLEAYKCGKLSLTYNNSSLTELFKDNFPYTTPGNEIMTLKKVLDLENVQNNFLKKEFTWSLFCKQFYQLLKFNA